MGLFVIINSLARPIGLTPQIGMDAALKQARFLPLWALTAAGSMPARTRDWRSRSPFSLYFCPARASRAVKSLVRWIAFVLLSGPAVLPAHAAFSSLYAFGDGVCTTTDNLGGATLTTPHLLQWPGLDPGAGAAAGTDL